MQKHHSQLVHAQALRAEIIAAPSIWVPRRSIVLDWLEGFIARAQGTNYALAETEAADLIALELFLRKMRIPVAI